MKRRRGLSPKFLSLNCIDWTKYIHRKSAAKLHMRTNVANMLPDFVVVDSAHRHEVAKAAAICADLRAGDAVERRTRNRLAVGMRAIPAIFTPVNESAAIFKNAALETLRGDLV